MGRLEMATHLIRGHFFSCWPNIKNSFSQVPSGDFSNWKNLTKWKFQLLIITNKTPRPPPPPPHALFLLDIVYTFNIYLPLNFAYQINSNKMRFAKNRTWIERKFRNFVNSDMNEIKVVRKIQSLHFYDLHRTSIIWKRYSIWLLENFVRESVKQVTKRETKDFEADNVWAKKEKRRFDSILRGNLRTRLNIMGE